MSKDRVELLAQDITKLTDRTRRNARSTAWDSAIAIAGLAIGNIIRAKAPDVAPQLQEAYKFVYIASFFPPVLAGEVAAIGLWFDLKNKKKIRSKHLELSQILREQAELDGPTSITIPEVHTDYIFRRVSDEGQLALHFLNTGDYRTPHDIKENLKLFHPVDMRQQANVLFEVGTGSFMEKIGLVKSDRKEVLVPAPRGQKRLELRAVHAKSVFAEAILQTPPFQERLAKLLTSIDAPSAVNS